MIEVAVGVILDDQGQVLIARRPPQAHQGDLWEFPGGKLEAGESVLDALRRELQEELGIVMAAGEFWFTQEYRYPDKHVALHVCRVLTFQGAARGVEGQPLRWVAIQDLHEWPFPSANKVIVESLQAGRYVLA